MAEYRTAIEALTAVVHELGTNPVGTAQTADAMLTELTADLSDGTIDGVVDGAASTVIDAGDITELTSLDPATLPIPGSDDGTGTPITVGDVEKVLVDEKTTTGESTSTTELEAGGSIDISPVPAVDEPSKDGDTIPDFIDNCPALANEDQADTNGNGVGDLCDDAPVANDDGPYNVDEGATRIITDVTNGVLDNDTDTEGDTLTAIIVDGPVNGDLTLNSNGTFTYTHRGDENTSDSFTYKANDGSKDSDVATVSITVTPVNDAPVAVGGDGTYSVAESATLTGAASVLTNDTDAEGDALTAAKVSDPTNGTLSLNSDGTFNYTHNGGETTSDSFTYKANDGSLDSNVVTVNITITPVNDAPVAVADGPYTVDEGATLTTVVESSVLNNDSDAEGDALTAIKVSDPSNGTVTLNSNGTFSYTHDGSETTSDSFTYKANDGSSDSNVVTVSITVSPVNDEPVAVGGDGPYTVAEDGTLTAAASVLTNDTDAEGDALTAVMFSAPSNGTATLYSMVLSITPIMAVKLPLIASSIVLMMGPVIPMLSLYQSQSHQSMTRPYWPMMLVALLKTLLPLSVVMCWIMTRMWIAS